MKIILSISYLMLIITFLLGCVSTTSQQTSAGNLDKILLGDSENKILSLWGQNAERSAESYASTQVELLNYSRPNGSPEVFFSIDPVTKKVIGKSQWVYSNKKIVQFERDLKNRFQNVSWEIYIPCHTQSNDDKILVNRDQGLSIDIGPGGSAVVSWSTPALLSLRINLIKETCPRLNP